jgi:glucan 1,3-beta-glucosidase
VARATNASAIAQALALFTLTALAIGITWWWLGAAVELPPSSLTSDKKLFCVSYAPFRDAQDPLADDTVEPAQIDADLALLSKYTNCVRTYSVGNGVDKVPEIARRYGLKVLHGIWIGTNAEKNRKQIATSIALAKEFPDVISAVIVGNEVLLRNDMSVADLMATIREVKSQVSEPVTYADVWEYWLRYRDLASTVDFVTIHILPYWEDFPLPASVAAAHVDEIRKKIAAAIPNKEIVVGEFGWPSAGRMREGARPSPSNQARAIEETLARAQRGNFRVNVIEAFDQPWKRWLEGTVGGHWGIFDRAMGAPKFDFAGGKVSDHPRWRMQALAGILLAALMFGGAFAAGHEKADDRLLWWKICAMAFLPAILFGWSIETLPVESFSPGGWLRSLALAGIAAATPLVCAVACAVGRPLPALASWLGRRGEGGDALHWALGATFIAFVLLSMEAALGLVFDPRYRDIAFAPLSAALIPFLVLRFAAPRPMRPVEAPANFAAMAERVAACLLVAAAAYIVINETFANWQAVWFCVGLVGLALILARARDAPG